MDDDHTALWGGELSCSETVYSPNLLEKLSEKGFEQRSNREFGRHGEQKSTKKERLDSP
jgi:hypothetical protein